jgi:leucyl aminopeptidase
MLSGVCLLLCIRSTDAEGRLTLADALWYAQEKAGATVRDLQQ